MGFLSELAKQVKELIGRLTTSQKIAFGLLVTLVVVFMGWFTVWGSRADYEALSAQPADATERTSTLNLLRTAGVNVRENGGVVEVAQGQTSRAMAVLAEGGALPSDFRLIRKTTNNGMFTTQEESRHAREVEEAEFLGDVIRHMEGIRMAKVVFDLPSPYEGVLQKSKGTASVVVWLKEKRATLSGQQVAGIAALISGALKDIPRENVQIVDGQGRPYHVNGSNSAVGNVSERQEQVLAYEESMAKRIEERLSFLGPVRVFVSARFDFSQKSTRTRKVDPNTVDVQQTTRKVTVEPVEATAGGEPGAKATPGTRNTTVEKSVKSEAGSTETNIEEPPGAILDMSVTAMVPREGVIAQLKSDGVKIDDKASAEELAGKLEEIRLCIANGLGIPDGAKVVVKAVSFPKTASIEEPAAAETAAGQTWNTYGTTAVLGAFVIAAMWMLWRMVKRPVEMRLDGGSGSALGLATGDEELLANLSGLDSEAVRRARLEKKVKEMVRENPKDAATLVTRWADTES